MLGIAAGPAAAGEDTAAFRRPAEPVAPSFAFNPTTPAKIALGRALFFDPKLSRSNRMSCASCHREDAAWADRQARSLNDDGQPMARRTQTLLGVGWVPRLGWTASIDVLEGFVLAPIARNHEMAQDLDALVGELAADPAYAPMMVAAFGDPTVTIAGISQGLAAFMRSLVPPETPFDRWLAGDASALSESAQAGFMLFKGKAGCAACHSGWRFTDDTVHDIGLAGNTAGRPFKTPSLRGVAARPPYMHDGSLPTLPAVMAHYVGGIRARPSVSPLLSPAALSDQEKLNLIDFLMSLDADK